MDKNNKINQELKKMKKYASLFMMVLIVFLAFSGCAKKQPGTVGEVIDISVSKAPENVVKYLWAFKTKPADSRLDPRDFLPSDDAEAVSFVPDVAGTYEVIVALVDINGKETNEIFVFEVTAPEGTPPAGQVVIPEPVTTPEELKAEPEPAQKETTAEKSDSESWKSAPAPSTAQKSAPRPKTSQPEPAKVSKDAVSIPKKDGSFTIQVASFKTYNQALGVADQLKEKGFDAYVQRAYFKDSDQIWYRVRVGSFAKKAEAAKVIESIVAQFPKMPKPWTDVTREDY
jgi:cell division septation protein DedD